MPKVCSHFGEKVEKRAGRLNLASIYLGKIIRIMKPPVLLAHYTARGGNPLDGDSRSSLRCMKKLVFQRNSRFTPSCFGSLGITSRGNMPE